MADEIFALQLKEFAEKAQANATTVVRKVATDLLTGVVKKTPVGNPDLWKHKAPPGYVGGRLRANWNVALGAPDETTTDAIDEQGDATIDRGVSITAKADGVQDIFIMNNLPYAIPLEYGHSQQAPFGMVRVTVANFQNYVNEAVSELEK